MHSNALSAEATRRPDRDQNLCLVRTDGDDVLAPFLQRLPDVLEGFAILRQNAAGIEIVLVHKS